MDEHIKHRIAMGIGTGLGLLSLFAPYVWHDMPTFLSYPGLGIGLLLLLWGIIPTVRKRKNGHPQIGINVGYEDHYVKMESHNLYNVTKSVLIGVKNIGGSHLSNCKLDFEVLSNEINQFQRWFREGVFSLNQGEERYVSVASYNEPLPPHPMGGQEIQLHAPLSGAYSGKPPTLPVEGGVVKFIATSAESPACEVLCHFWVQDGKLRWKTI